MIRSYFDKFTRLVFDVLKVFLVFFFFMQLGKLHLSVHMSFLITIGLASISYFINGLLKADKFQKFLPLVGIGVAFVFTIGFYSKHTLIDQGALTIYHLLIWVVSARNLRERVVTKQTMLHLFLPITIISLVLFAIYFVGAPYKELIGVVYPYMIMFYAVTFMVAVKINLDDGYKSDANKEVNAINKRRNQIIFSFVPNLIIIVIFVAVMAMDFADPVLSPVDGQVVDLEAVQTETILPPGQRVEDVEYKDLKEGKSLQSGDTSYNERFKIGFISGETFRRLVDILGLVLIVYFISRFIKKSYNKKYDQDPEDMLEIRESLLTKESVKEYFSKFFKKRPVKEALPEERRLYKDYVKSLLKSYDFNDSETASAFKSKVNKPVLDDLTDMYENYRYGGRQAGYEEINSLKKKINDK